MTYVLVPGAGGRAWYWHLVVARLKAHGREALAVELPADDDTRGLPDYAQAVLDAARGARDVVVVAASLGAFTAPVVADPLEAVAVVLVNPMIPRPGERPSEWWVNTGAVEARTENDVRRGYPASLDPAIHLFHDVPPQVLATATPRGEQSPRPFRDAGTCSSGPAAPTVIAGRADRFFPLPFQQRLARERLGREPVVVPGGHLVALSRPDELTTAIVTATSGS